MAISKAISARYGDGVLKEGRVSSKVVAMRAVKVDESFSLIIYLPLWTLKQASQVGTVTLTDCLTETYSRYAKIVIKLKQKRKRKSGRKPERGLN